MNVVGIGAFARLSRLSAKALRRYDALGLLVPARVDPRTGYRWYDPAQLDQARQVAALRRLGVPPGRIRAVLALEPAAAAEEIGAYWAEAEAEHAARRELVGRLTDRLQGRDRKECTMYEVDTRELPARRMLCLLRRARQEELVPIGRELFIHRLRRGRVPRAEGIAGAPFMIYYGEVGGDGDGPVEWCWPVPEDQADALAARFPDLALRTEPGHQEAFVRQGTPGAWASGTQALNAIETLSAWVTEHGRRPYGGIRLVLVPNPANSPNGPDSEFALPLH